VFSVDVAEGMTVTFDSYPKADGSRKSEYGNEQVIRYPGITIEQVMASGTLPEFYYHARVPIHPDVEQKDQDLRCMPDKSDSKNNKNIRYFWDGGLLSNTPLRELLQAHQEYWNGIENKDKIPDLDVYIVNIHPSKIDINMIPQDRDGVKNRQNDIIFGDRTSHYDEKIAHLITDYTDFVTQMKDLADEAIRKVNDENNKEELKKKLESILEINTLAKIGKT